MANAENPQGNSRDAIELMARIIMGSLKAEGENNQFFVSYWRGVMAEDEKFRAAVYSRVAQLSEKGRKIPLFTHEELQNAKRHRKRRKETAQPALQPPLFDLSLSTFEQDPSDIEGTNQEREMDKIFGSLEGRFRRGRIIREEVKQKKQELREKIDLPPARGKNPHVGDRFYKFLVRGIVTSDRLGIFNEYDRAIGGVTPELSAKINEVKAFVEQVQNSGYAQKEKYKKYYQFVEEYEKKWKNTNH
jgi:hypothetical protein